MFCMQHIALLLPTTVSLIHTSFPNVLILCQQQCIWALKSNNSCVCVCVCVLVIQHLCCTCSCLSDLWMKINNRAPYKMFPIVKQVDHHIAKTVQVIAISLCCLLFRLVFLSASFLNGHKNQHYRTIQWYVLCPSRTQMEEKHLTFTAVTNVADSKKMFFKSHSAP